MKKIFLLFAAPVVLLLLWLTLAPGQVAGPSPEATPVYLTAAITEPQAEQPIKANKRDSRKAKADVQQWYAAKSADSEPLVSYALGLIGSPYVYGGTSPNGFDCSGFTSHVFKEFGVPVTRSSGTQSQDGISVEREDAQPGDLVIFTGTNEEVREPGHVGIVISEPGDTISFVHSSSNGGVKISQVEGTGYEDRFLDIRRVL
ncbi:C40 family peptidase [Pontibacter roseus]|uniref:C40 family peptidase n=1 Tax=Pontibacter roseus TaxID=336989 RepID=UPI0003619ACE|nr:C40 family peptidase [Pontibacter roseus]